LLCNIILFITHEETVKIDFVSTWAIKQIKPDGTLNCVSPIIICIEMKKKKMLKMRTNVGVSKNHLFFVRINTVILFRKGALNDIKVTV